LGYRYRVSSIPYTRMVEKMESYGLSKHYHTQDI